MRGTYAPSDQAREITKSRSFTKPSRVLARFSLDGCDPEATDTNLVRGFSFRLGSDGQRSEILAQSAPVHFARTLDQMLAFLRHTFRNRTASPTGEDLSLLRRQSRNAASGELHRRASVASKLCPHDLLGRACFSRDELERRDAVHQVQGHAGRRRNQAGRERGHGDVRRPFVPRPRLNGSRPATSDSA